jgi:uncharacterized membrane protein
MSGFLANFRNTILASLLLSLIVAAGLGFHAPGGFDAIYLQSVLRWLHVVFGILWIGLLYYFNFVQLRVMPLVPAELKPGITKYIAPEALFWFRYAALFTVIIGLVLAWLRGYERETLTLGLYNGYEPSDAGFAFLGLGMWLGLIMLLNVWHFIWPAQKIALGIREGFDTEAKAKAARKAMVFSRINLLLSLPMLATMAMYQTLFG